MANFDKYSKGACGHMLKHYERGKDANGEYVRFGNQDIDTSRSHLNYNLGPERSGSQYSFIKERCSEVYCLNRADVNVLGSWVVTAPKGLDPAEHDRFFRTAYKALEEKYGRENVVSAWVHKDESGQPHMHFAFVPVVWDAKKERYTVRAKDAVSRAELKKFHPWLTQVMQQEFGYDVGVETGELGTRGNLTMEQYKAVQEANSQAKEAQERLAALEQKARELDDRLNALRPPEEVQKVEGKPSMTGRYVKVKTAEYELLKDYAENGAALLEAAQENASKAASWQQWCREEEKRRQKAEDELAKYRLGIHRAEAKQLEGYLEHLTGRMADVFEKHPEAYKTFREQPQPSRGSDSLYAPMNWKIQSMLDEAMGTDYARQDKARYFAKKNGHIK